jgi:hypothetical protein
MIHHPQGRERALEPFGPTGRRAEWIALASEAARVENAVRGMDDAMVEALGGLNACLCRLVEMRQLLRSTRPERMIDAHSVWRSRHLSGVRI